MLDGRWCSYAQMIQMVLVPAAIYSETSSHVFVWFFSFFHHNFCFKFKPKVWAVEPVSSGLYGQSHSLKFWQVLMQAFLVSAYLDYCDSLCTCSRFRNSAPWQKKKERGTTFPLCRPRFSGSVLQHWLEVFVYPPSVESEHIHDDLCLCSSTRSHRTSHKISFLR